ncbi:hypothetical protein [Benzoatithermus flavus]|uniref:Uncharacterized protein n=1 Tax=Benzoatithermus flavus TaxID=3108223 RepID=A0ABU8XPY3_9PROT
MSPHQHRREDQDARDVLQGIAAALPPSLVLCGVVAFVQTVLDLAIR